MYIDKIMKSIIIEIIETYLSDVNSIVGMMKKELSVDDLHKARIKRSLSQNGTLSNGYTYHFHGFGCCVEFNNGKNCIDFEFGTKGRKNGFDLQRIQFYVEKGKQCVKPEWLSCDLENEFNKLIEQNVIYCPLDWQGAYLYYFTDKH